MDDRPDFEPLDKLRLPKPTPFDEICSCSKERPLKLMTTLGHNPFHWLNCNLETLDDHHQASASGVQHIGIAADSYEPGLGSKHLLHLDDLYLQLWRGSNFSSTGRNSNGA